MTSLQILEAVRGELTEIGYRCSLIEQYSTHQNFEIPIRGLIIETDNRHPNLVTVDGERSPHIVRIDISRPDSIAELLTEIQRHSVFRSDRPQWDAHLDGAPTYRSEPAATRD